MKHLKHLKRLVLMICLILGLIAGSLSGCSLLNQSRETQTVKPGTEQQQSTAGKNETEQQRSTAEKPETEQQQSTTQQAVQQSVEKGQSYHSKEEVAQYIHLYGELPPNYLTKNEAEKKGWDNRKGNLWEVAPGASIGGNKFGNYEKKLPEKKGRTYYECDIDYEGGYRGAKRLVYSSDGLVFYTEDHYETFEQLY